MHTAFTELDVIDGQFPRISTQEHRKELIFDPPAWMKAGLRQTASGYGMKLNSGYKIDFNGKLYRVYATCISNVASNWFTTKGKRIYVD